MSLALEWAGWSEPRPGRFTPGKEPVPNAQEVGWDPGPVWTCAKILVPTGTFFFNFDLYYINYVLTLLILVLYQLKTHRLFFHASCAT
jgi:hypothetical protein